MRYLQYKGVVEREYKMSLKKIMYQLCVVEGLNTEEGAKKLGIAKEIFAYWKHNCRFEKRQMLFDKTVEDLKNLQHLYAEEVKEIDIKRPLLYSQEKTIRSLEEAVNRELEYYKYVHFESSGFSLKTAQLPLYEFSRFLIENYKEGKLSIREEENAQTI